MNKAAKTISILAAALVSIVSCDDQHEYYCSQETASELIERISDTCSGMEFSIVDGGIVCTMHAGQRNVIITTEGSYHGND